MLGGNLPSLFVGCRVRVEVEAAHGQMSREQGVLVRWDGAEDSDAVLLLDSNPNPNPDPNSNPNPPPNSNPHPNSNLNPTPNPNPNPNPHPHPEQVLVIDSETGAYLPPVFINEFWRPKDALTSINETVAELPP